MFVASNNIAAQPLKVDDTLQSTYYKFAVASRTCIFFYLTLNTFYGHPIQKLFLPATCPMVGPRYVVKLRLLPGHRHLHWREGKGPRRDTSDREYRSNVKQPTTDHVYSPTLMDDDTVISRRRLFGQLVQRS